jgi:hypothetical protein
MKVYKLTHGKMAGSCTFPENGIDEIVDEISFANVGEKFEIEVQEMSQEDFDKLPEFEGW